MNRSRRTTIVLGHLLAAATLALTACGGGEETSEGSEGSESPSAGSSESTGPDLEGIPEVVAEVNGEELAREDFVAVYEAQYRQAQTQAQAGGEAPDEEALREQVADGLVDAALLRQEAEDRGIDASAQDVDDRLAELATQNQLGSAEEFLAALEDQGTPEEQVRGQVETEVLAERLVNDEGGRIEPTERELRALYARAERQQEQAQGQQGQQGQQAQQPLPPFRQVRDQLEQQAVAQEQGRVAQQLVTELREDADITVNL